MDKNKFLNLIKLVREHSKKRHFSQTFDLIINLKGINIKNQDHNVDLFLSLTNTIGKKPRICALVGKELANQAKVFDNVITMDQFPEFKDKKKVKDLARKYDYFVAQANIMANIASTFGKTLGPTGKMPNPKAGCVVPPSANLQELKTKLENTVRIKTKAEPIIKAPLGKEDLTDDQILENFNQIYNALTHVLPSEENNIGSIYLKLTMSRPIRLGQKAEEILEEEPKKKKKVKKTGKKEKKTVKVEAEK
ncbi:hypothetical protein K8R47_02530 [archaeon]|nr:hypothetical protein [archaeon]